MRLVAAAVPLMMPVNLVRAQSPAASPAELVRRSVTHELAAANAGGHYMYRLRKETARGSETRDMIETRDWLIGRLVLRDGRQLSAAQQQKEDERLRKLISDRRAREEFRRDQHHEEERVRRMMRSLPDAFLYSYESTEQDADRSLVRLSFRPNPNFSPPSRELQVLQGMTGTMVIDPVAERLVRVDARLVRDVDFGWGILGRLYGGGSFLLEQRDVGSGRWAITELALHFTGRILLFKSLRIDSVAKATDFRRMPEGLTIQQGFQFLLDRDRMATGANEVRRRR